ncbi:hypothetical protein [Longimicrobium sp.]|uniref:hypothetical protein n=1 Tax=Longimicrobium sp. TaxID=2029185 RepID=UPI002BFDA49F|nr:hypothetical protein [Longimicrobium sp.]HSU15953.1 hypothetical protein [Longimicrobium sp.]
MIPTAASTTPEPRSAPARDEHGGGRAFARRIECDSARSARATPARGGGMRDPEAWEQLRSTRG